jgi:hypothetical protein
MIVPQLGPLFKDHKKWIHTVHDEPRRELASRHYCIPWIVDGSPKDTNTCYL